MKESKKKPEIVVFAGPNGSGKSTITKWLRPIDMIYINADDIKANLDCSDLEAAQIAERRRETQIDKRESFCFETVMSTDRNLKLLRRGKENGFFIRCYYILTKNARINISRIQTRVAEGKHDVPNEKVISRYDKALKLIPVLIPLCDVCHIYDNSLDKPYRIFKKRKDEYFYSPESLVWKKPDIVQLTGIIDIDRANLNRDR